MKKILMILFCLFTAMTVDAQGIYFEDSPLDSVLAKGKAENKLIFIDAYTPWCYWCKWMDKNTFANDTVGQFMNTTFINKKIDMWDSITNKPLPIAEHYQVFLYPTYLIVDGNDNVIHRFSGAWTVSKFIEAVEQMYDPQRAFGALHGKYKSGSITSSEFLQYLIMRDKSNMPIRKELSEYMIRNRADIDISNGTDSIGEIICNLYRKQFAFYLRPGDNQDTSAYRVLRKEIIDMRIPESTKLVLIGDMFLYFNIKNWNAYAQTAIVYVDAYIPNSDFQTLNNLAWHFYEHIDNPVYLDKAIGWAKQSVETKQVFFNTDTYAALLYKRGRYEEALEQVKKAVELAKTECTEDYTATIQLQKKVEIALGIQ